MRLTLREIQLVTVILPLFITFFLVSYGVTWIFLGLGLQVLAGCIGHKVLSQALSANGHMKSNSP